MGIRTRIFFIVSCLFFIGISLTFIIAERDLSNGFETQVRGELSKQTNILKQALKPHLYQKSNDQLKVIVDQYADAAQSRITIINWKGEVIADSKFSNSELLELDNHQNRPEIIQALSSGEGSSKRFRRYRPNWI
jgi:two-component system phosphate regulon sensor histidine kinase PhoR